MDEEPIWKWISWCRKVEQTLLWLCICLVPILVILGLLGLGLTPEIMAGAWALLLLVTLGFNLLRKGLVRKAGLH